MSKRFVTDFDPNEQHELEDQGFVFSHQARESNCPICGANRWSENFNRAGRGHGGYEHKSILWSQCLCKKN